MPNTREFNIASAWYTLSKVSGHSGGARVKRAMNDQRRYLQAGNLFNNGRLLSEAVTVFPKNTIDLEIDVQTIH